MSTELRTAAVVLSGSELLDGRVRDEDGAFVSADLSERGVRVTSVVMVADDRERLSAALKWSLAASPDLLVIGGGLGTTHDDLTAQCLAEVLGVELEEDAVALAMLSDSLRAVAERRGTTVAELLPAGRRQALLPRTTTPLPPVGVAPGIKARSGKTRIFALPGVPYEFRAMWRNVARELAAEGFFPQVVSRLVRIVGCGELPVAAALRSERSDLLETGVTVDGGEVTVKLRYRPTVAAARQAAAVIAALRRSVPVFSTDGRTVDDIVADALVARGGTLAVAESCTGGSLGGRITARPGSSAYFRGGVISYSDDVKEQLLGVSGADLRRCGAVSAEVAAAMAAGARVRCGARYGLAVTGIAGPGGATPEKPVGLVYIACSGPYDTSVVRERFPGDRAEVRAHGTTRSLHLLREYLKVGPAE